MQKITRNFDKPKGSTFARITRGDITKWAHGANRFEYPEPKNKRVKTVQISSKAACVLRPVARPVAQERVVMIASVPEAAGSKPDLADMIDKGLEISDMMNRRLGLLR